MPRCYRASAWISRDGQLYFNYRCETRLVLLHAEWLTRLETRPNMSAFRDLTMTSCPYGRRALASQLIQPGCWLLSRGELQPRLI
jgi:hypothetical protein